MNKNNQMTDRFYHLRLDFIAHWIWAILFSLLALSGFSMMGAKFGWMLGYAYPLADLVHRAVSVLFVFWVLLAIIYEIVRRVTGNTAKISWLPVGKKGFAGFTFLTTLLLILSGFLLWFHPNIPYVFGTFGFVAHELVALLAIGSVVWHIWDKRWFL